MRVLHTEWSDGWGGQEIRVLLEARLLNEAGHDAIIACRPCSELYKRALDSSVETIPLNIKGPLDIRSALRLRHIIRDRGIDIINTHSSHDSWVGLIASWLTLPPVFVRTRHLSVPVKRRFLNFIYTMPDAIITTSKTIRDMLVSELGIEEENVVSIPTGVDIRRFNIAVNKGQIKDSLGIGGRAPVITTVGVLRSWKGHRVIIDAVKDIIDHYPEALFLFVGDGPQRSSIEGLISEKGLGEYVRLMGYRDDIPEILSASDLLLHPSLSYEGVPQSVLQAMATKVPVVATDVGGIVDVLIDGETGILIKPGSPDEIVRGIRGCLDNRDRALRMTERARLLVEKEYTLEVMMDRILKLYNDLINKKRRTEDDHRQRTA